MTVSSSVVPLGRAVAGAVASTSAAVGVQQVQQDLEDLDVHGVKTCADALMFLGNSSRHAAAGDQS